MLACDWSSDVCSSDLGGVTCISEVIDISPGNLDSSSCFFQSSVKRVTIYSLDVLPFPTLNQSVFSCLSVASCPAYRFLRRQVRWSDIPNSKNFPLCVIHTVKGFSAVNETEDFLQFPCFFNDPKDVGNLISGSSVFSKFSLYIWKLSVHVLLKHSLKDFERYFASM